MRGQKAKIIFSPILKDKLNHLTYRMSTGIKILFFDFLSQIWQASSAKNSVSSKIAGP